MAYLSKPQELQAIFERPRMRLVRENGGVIPAYVPVTDIDRLIMREIQWPSDAVYIWELRAFEKRLFAYGRAIDVIEFAQKRNTWTGELFT